MTRACLERMLFIAGELRARHMLRTRHLAERFEVSTKTIGRDFYFLRDRMGYDIAYDYAAEAWRLNSEAPKARL